MNEVNYDNISSLFAVGEYDFSSCNLCPRECGADRIKGIGRCRASASMAVARAALHHWEEPCISGVRGSGTIFFTGCQLGCVFCQNGEISRGENPGKTIDAAKLREICFKLKEKGAHNINLVTPTHYSPLIYKALYPIKKELGLPIVCNTGGYDSIRSLEYLAMICDVFLPDFKFSTREAGLKFAKASDYPEVAIKAIRFMADVTGKPVFDDEGMLVRGTVVRHLVLPGERAQSIEAIDLLGKNFKNDEILVSLMSQYTPMEGAEGSLKRRITGFEYSSVVKRCEMYGFDGFLQDKSSAKKEYTPDFDLEGI